MGPSKKKSKASGSGGKAKDFVSNHGTTPSKGSAVAGQSKDNESKSSKKKKSKKRSKEPSEADSGIPSSKKKSK